MPRWFKVKLAIGVAGYVQADYHIVSGNMLRFYSQADAQEVATYSIHSVASVEECVNGDKPKVVMQPEIPSENRKAS